LGPAEEDEIMKSQRVCIIGAGPAGLTTAYELVQQGLKPIVLEKADRVGGIARTEEYKGYAFDIGGHRYFTKNREIEELWTDMMGDDFREVRRLSRIYYRGRFFHYPFRLANAVGNLGLLESMRVALSYLHAKIFPSREEKTFEQWVSNRFGRRLYEMFFRSYTEKVWGIPCQEIEAEWAAQRIRGLSLGMALANTLLRLRTAKSLIDRFHYPRRGPGMMWERFRQEIDHREGTVLTGAEAVGLRVRDRRVTHVRYRTEHGQREVEVDAVVSTAPIPILIDAFDPPAPEAVRDAASALAFRALVVVVLFVDMPQLFPDQWIYIHSRDVRVGRIQNFKNWSPDMVPDPATSSVGMEYFCTEGDDLWLLSDGELRDLAARELQELGLVVAEHVTDGCVVRQPYAYPVYFSGYRRHLRLLRDHLGSVDNLHTIGRSGTHRYNNMDHSMLTGLLAARNILGGSHDPWRVNDEAEYIEERRESDLEVLGRQMAVLEAALTLDPIAFALASGTVCGLALFLATLWLCVKGGPVVGPHLILLSQYFIGYRVTVPGAFVGLAYAFGCGFGFGWIFAALRNLFLGRRLQRLERKAEVHPLRDL